jgi:GNAT superfamily N-acetyltransferase
MFPDVRIGYLADHPEALPTLERLFETEWAGYYGAAGPGDAHRDLVAYSNRSQLPVGLVAFLDSEPCGVAALKADSISTHKHLTPWIGGGMVAPQFRRQGIGARLVSALEAVARGLGFTTVYSGTSTANSLLVREGWQFMEVVQHDGEAISIYEKAL